MKKQLLNLTFAAVIMFSATLAKAQYAEPVQEITFPAITAIPNVDADGSDASYGDFYTDMKIAKRAGAAIAAYEDGAAPDFDGQFKACWSANYLYLYIEVIDDVFEPYLNGQANSWTWDNIETFIDLDTNSTTNTYSETSTTQIRICPGLETAAGADSIVESSSRGDIGRYKSAWSKTPDGYIVEVGIPWLTATTEETVDIAAKIAANTVIGWDFAIADADGDGSGTEGGRNVEGGAQMFWDLDTDDPLSGNEDNAYQNRRVFGFMILDGTPVDDPIVAENVNSVNKSSIFVYPNPAVDVLYINDYFGSATIYSVTGSVVMEVENVNESINISNLTSGVYFLKIGNETAKFLVK